MGTLGGPDTASEGATLADALRSRRQAAALSQERLAELAGVSVRTIRNIEGGRVRAPRLASVGALAEALSIGGAERGQFIALAVDHDDDLGRGGASDEGSVPAPLVPLVGRDPELGALTRILSAPTVRLVTLTGVAGVGKTRLALELARRCQATGPAWWVPLASISDVRHVVDAIAAVVDAPVVSPAGIAERIGQQPALLALDNLEHLVGIDEVLADLLGRMPATTVLATSRAPVGVTGEHEWPVRPLALPTETQGDPGVLGSVESVQLLVQRVRAVTPGFELTSRNGPVVGEICRRLDGLPLALELAAKQWRVRGAHELLRSVRRDPLSLRDLSDTATPQHASLLNALDASYGLLGDAARQALGCLSVFPSSWGVDAATAVVDDKAAVDHLDRLVALGLVHAESTVGGAEPRFSMLPIIRAFAAAKARSRGDSEGHEGAAEAAAGRHALYFHRWLADVSTRQPAPSGLLEMERDNLRAALDWLRDHTPTAGLEMAGRLYQHWRNQGREREGLDYFEDLLARVDDAAVDAETMLRAAILAHEVGRFGLARRLAAQALTSYRDRRDARGSALAFTTLGMTEIWTDPVAAVVHGQAAVEQAEVVGDPALFAWSQERLGMAFTQLGRMDEAIAAYERDIEIARRHGLRELQVQGMLKLVFCLLFQRDVAAADRLLVEVAPLAAEADDVACEACWFCLWAVLSAQRGDAARAVEVLVTKVDSVTPTVSLIVGHMRNWARAELQLALDQYEKAAITLRTILAKQSELGYPLYRLIPLAGLAQTARDIDTAARAVRAADLLHDRYGLTTPLLLGRRLDAARERWIEASGRAAWDARVLAVSGRTLDELVHDLVAPEPTSEVAGRGVAPDRYSAVS